MPEAAFHQRWQAAPERAAPERVWGTAVGKGKSKTGSATTTAKKGQGSAQKAMPAASMGRGSSKDKAKQGTGEQAVRSSDDDACPEAPSKASRAAPARAASKRKPVYVKTDTDSDYECDYGSKSDLGWSKRPGM